jgi:hypothetical protein
MLGLFLFVLVLAALLTGELVRRKQHPLSQHAEYITVLKNNKQIFLAQAVKVML